MIPYNCKYKKINLKAYFKGVTNSKQQALSTEDGVGRTKHNFKFSSITVGVSPSEDLCK